jgi:beta-mannosidase
VKQSKDVDLSRKVLELKLVNDCRTPASGTLKLQTMTLDGRVVFEQKQKVRIPKNDAIDVKTWRVQDILGGEPASNVIFYITFTTGDRTYYNIAYPERQKDMNYRHANIAVTAIRPMADGFSLSVKSDIFARAVFLKTKGIKDFFSDNYFDLFPGEERTLTVRTTKPLAQFEKELEITSLGDTYK